MRFTLKGMSTTHVEFDADSLEDAKDLAEEFSHDFRQTVTLHPHGETRPGKGAEHFKFEAPEPSELPGSTDDEPEIDFEDAPSATPTSDGVDQVSGTQSADTTPADS